MRVLISDANILIDLEEGRIIESAFMAPFDLCVPDILFHEELEEQHDHLLALGLGVLELSGESLGYAGALGQSHSAPSRNDLFALALARQEQCPLLTGDKALRVVAEQEGVDVRGTLWLVEHLVVCNLLDVAMARDAYKRMRERGRRLPWKLAEEGLHGLERSLSRRND
ncbi:PIN domain-containing protein [Alloalcanivorax xenomutans]|uniref:PIN domain-containing protein n=1 Tax=Alloalcanivorax xenomutans TaxID=1094342 RepID=UPI0003B8694F|nr:PIN domain-containing protein [Alloalcanivorax xenomutans]ERS11325.1 hypothetical protein Q668_18830 [Alcanivorax sp. PN-3]MBA4719486.1 PIN domain-containing protein [Alcanivorax sp.]